MEHSTAIVVTSISLPNVGLKNLAEGCRRKGYKFIVVGDRKSPKEFSIEGCDFLSIDEQKMLKYKLADLCPENHYSRKNIGYLKAIKGGSKVIIETDDDNIPYRNFWDSKVFNKNAYRVDKSGWFNVYSIFTKNKIWPRGFPLENLNDSDYEKTELKKTLSFYPIQQGLADNSPDVDAIYRMIMKLPIKFSKSEDVTLSEGTWCPFNSQNTTWSKEAYALMYLPSYCSFRMTDIWRSFIAQRIAWTCGWEILFHRSTVYQDRNEHSLINDFEEEIPGYLNNSKICEKLSNLDLSNGINSIYDNLIKCYSVLIDLECVAKEEYKLLNAWIEDIEF